MTAHPVFPSLCVLWAISKPGTTKFRRRVSPTNLVSHDFWRQIITFFSSYKSQSTTHSVNVTSVSYFEKNQWQTFLWPGKFRHSITKLVICAVPWCNLVQKLNISLKPFLASFCFREDISCLIECSDHVTYVF